MADFLPAFNHTLHVEGGFADHPDDPGGKTRFGITEAVARANGYRGNMKTLPLTRASKIYKSEYWDSQNLGKIANQQIAEEVFDTGVNMGIRTAGKIFQRAINLFRDSGLKEDGKIGVRTLEAYSKIKYKTSFLKCLNGFQFMYYYDLIQRKPRLKVFFKGWVRRT